MKMEFVSFEQNVTTALLFVALSSLRSSAARERRAPRPFGVNLRGYARTRRYALAGQLDARRFFVTRVTMCDEYL